MLKIGSVIGGKYKILSVIGRGGMSVVYLALNEAANKPWAVKELLKKEAWEREADRREIEMMKRLRNPHLPGIADVIEQGDSLLIVMDTWRAVLWRLCYRNQARSRWSPCWPGPSSSVRC